MPPIACTVTIGGWSIDSAADPRTELLEIDTVRALNAPIDRCRLTLYAPPPPQAGLLEQMAGAAVGAAAGALGLNGAGPGGGAKPPFVAHVRGQEIKPGDRIAVNLTAGDRSAAVTVAAVQSIQTSLTTTTIVGRTGVQKLVATRLNQVYQNQTLGQIARDLAGQAGVDTGEITAGSSYPYLVVDDGRHLFAHLHALARRDGCDLFFDAANKLTLRPFAATAPDHTLHYGIDLLDLQSFGHAMGATKVRVAGESPASNKGLDTWPWLVKDLSPFMAEVGEGTALLPIASGALRTKDAAGLLATTLLGAQKDQATRGRLKLLGRPDIEPGQAIELKGVPNPELNGLFKVTAVRHRFGKEGGFVTWVDYTGQGGAAAGDLLSQLGGALAGAIGL